MNKELLLLNKKQTDTLINQTITQPQALLAFKMNKQMENSSFNPPISLAEGEKCFLAVTSFDATNFVFNIPLETIVVQKQHQVIGVPKMAKTLLTS